MNGKRKQNERDKRDRKNEVIKNRVTNCCYLTGCNFLNDFRPKPTTLINQIMKYFI